MFRQFARPVLFALILSGAATATAIAAGGPQFLLCSLPGMTDKDGTSYEFVAELPIPETSGGMREVVQKCLAMNGHPQGVSFGKSEPK